MSSLSRERRRGLSCALVALAIEAVSGCLGCSTSSQNPPDAGGSPLSGACDSAATWQVSIGGSSAGGSLAFTIPSSDANGGSWSPTSGISYSFDSATCTVTFSTAGCSGIGTFNLGTRACTLLTAPSCAQAPCDAGCPTQPATCTITML
jgi:hypothetical protein